MKYFVVSDIHSCYTALINSLNDAGYDKNNDDHILICCGDIFDRGEETIEVYDFLKSIPKNRRILIRGNHEYLLRNLVKRNIPEYHDWTNGTVKTIAHFNNEPDDIIMYMGANYGDNKKLKKVIKWIFSDEWCNYFELANYIFVHSFIPLKDNEYDADWRNNKDEKAWEKATWGCPYELYDKYFTYEKNHGRIIVYGHWHTWRIKQYYDKTLRDNNILDFSIFQQENQIGLDACTNYSNKVNVLLLEL